MEAIGIDVGSYKAVMGVVKRGGIDIVLNDASNRQTPVAIAYRDQERIIGDSAKMQVRKNFMNTVLYISRFAGLNAACVDQVELEKRFMTNKMVSMDNQKIGFEVN